MAESKPLLPTPESPMTTVNIMTGGVFLLIAVSWEFLWPIDAIAGFVLLLAIRWLLPVRLRVRFLALQGLCIAAAIADGFIVDFWISSFLLIGRHVGMIGIAFSVLFGLRRKRLEPNPAMPRIRLRIVAGFGLLIVSVVSLIIYLSAARWQRSEVYLAAAAVALVAHLLVVIRALWFRWGKSAFLYPVSLFLLPVLFCPLVWDSLYLHTIWKANSHQGIRPLKASRLAGIDIPSPTLMGRLDCVRHKDAAVRQYAVRGIGFSIFEFDDVCPPFPSWDTDEWWKDRYWDGAWSNPMAEQVMPILIDLLGDNDGKVRMQTLHEFTLLGPLGRPAIPALRKLLRERGGVSASRMEHTGDLKLSDLLNLPNMMSDELQNMDAGITRMGVADAFGYIGPAACEAVPDLIPLLQDVIWPVRVNAALALGNMGPCASTAIPALEAAARDQGFGDQSRSEAAFALWKIDRENSTIRLTFEEILRSGIFSANIRTEEGDLQRRQLSLMGPRVADWALPALMPLLNDEDPVVRDAVVGVLCHVGAESQEAVEAVLESLRSQLETEARPPWELESHFRSLIGEARGPGAVALVTGIREIDSPFWSSICAGKDPQMKNCDPAVMAALQGSD